MHHKTFIFLCKSFICIGILLAFIALGASVAQAETLVTRPAVGINPIEKAVTIADAYWGGSYCGGNYPIAYSPTPPSTLNAGPDTTALAEGKLVVQAWATFGDPTCTINLNSTIWTPETEALQFHSFCDVITHEIGHFFGHLDEGQTDPSSIEYPTVDEESPNYNSVPGCINIQMTEQVWITTPAEKAFEIESLKEVEVINRKESRKHRKSNRKAHRKTKHHKASKRS